MLCGAHDEVTGGHGEVVGGDGVARGGDGETVRQCEVIGRS